MTEEKSRRRAGSPVPLENEMSNHFKVHELLDASELEELEAFAREPGRTVDECHQWLQVKGFTLCRSAVGGWKQKFDQVLMAERMSGAGGLASAFMKAAQADGGLQIPDAAVLQLAQMIFEKGASLANGGDVQVEDLNHMALSLQRLMLAKARVEKTRTEMQDREHKALAEAGEAAKAGATGEQVVTKVRELLGLPV